MIETCAPTLIGLPLIAIIIAIPRLLWLRYERELMDKHNTLPPVIEYVEGQEIRQPGGEWERMRK